MIILSTINDTLELITSSAANVDYYIAYADITTTTFSPSSTQGTIASATTTTILSAPAASTQRQVKLLTIVNRHASTSCNVTLQKDVSATNYQITGTYSLGAGDSLRVDSDGTINVFDRNGRLKTNDTDTVGYTGFPLEFHKIGTASEAIGNWYSFFKDSGFPGAYSLGAPGLNGWWVDASQTTNAANPAGAAQVGVHRLANPASGSYYVNNIGVGSSVAHLLNLIDIIWYNTGAVVTTTTAQAITVPGASKPSRDMYGSTNGDGWQIGILVTTATTNAGAITNMTCSYTDSDGNAGNTATIASFPATAVIGTFVPFQLAAGDRGVRSVESLTLGTSLAAGAVSLIIYRTIAYVVNPVANVGGIMNKLTSDPTGTRIYNGSALGWIYRSSATTATTMSGCVNIVER